MTSIAHYRRGGAQQTHHNMPIRSTPVEKAQGNTHILPSVTGATMENTSMTIDVCCLSHGIRKAKASQDNKDHFPCCLVVKKKKLAMKSSVQLGCLCPTFQGQQPRRQSGDCAYKFPRMNRLDALFFKQKSDSRNLLINRLITAKTFTLSL